MYKQTDYEADQKNQLTNCILHCQGKDISCPVYPKIEPYVTCYMKAVLYNDEAKLMAGRKDTTFNPSVLEELIGIREQRDKDLTKQIFKFK